MFQKTLSTLSGNVFMEDRWFYSLGFFNEIWRSSVQRMRYTGEFKVQLD